MKTDTAILAIQDIRYKICIKKFIKNNGVKPDEPPVLQIKINNKWQDVRTEVG